MAITENGRYIANVGPYMKEVIFITDSDGSEDTISSHLGPAIDDASPTDMVHWSVNAVDDTVIMDNNFAIGLITSRSGKTFTITTAAAGDYIITTYVGREAEPA